MTSRTRAILLTALFLAACGEGAAEKAARESREKALAAERRAETVLTGMEQKVADLRARAGATARGTTREARETLTALEEKLTAARVRLDELKASSRDAAGDAAEKLREASDDLERSYRDAASRFN